MKNEQMVYDNMRLVHHLLNRYYPTFKNNEDMIQSGMLALCKASDSFDESRGTSFSTYASKCIMNEFRQEVQKLVTPHNILSLDYKKYDDKEDDFFDDVFDNSEFLVLDDVDKIITINEFLETLDDRERKICEYKRLGYNDREISELCDFGKRGNINRIFCEIKRKWRKHNEDSRHID